MERVTKKTLDQSPRVPRGWGYEIWLENVPDYCGKVLFLKAGKKCSMHFHVKKLETMFCQSGLVDIKFIDPADGSSYVVTLNPGDSLQIPRNQVHQICAIEDSFVIEFSTQHFEDDSHRVAKGD